MAHLVFIIFGIHIVGNFTYASTVDGVIKKFVIGLKFQPFQLLSRSIKKFSHSELTTQMLLSQ